MFEQRQVSITAAIHNAVHTIVDFYERIDKSSLSLEEDDLFRAFIYVNNQINGKKYYSRGNATCNMRIFKSFVNTHGFFC